MNTLTQTLITPPKEAKLDSSELKTPPNTMGGNPPIYHKDKKDKKETKCCKTAKKCACMLAFSCGISTVIVTILNM